MDLKDQKRIELLTREGASSLDWQMTAGERLALQGLLRRIQPDVAIEIGTYRGGSLQVIQRFSNKAVSLDSDPTVRERLQHVFPDVDFQCGVSHQLLPEVLTTYQTAQHNIEFILIDGDHSSEGVRADITALLRWQPKTDCVVLMHDSFNPDCREGIKTAAWSSSPYVQTVELDFVPGIYHQKPYDMAEARTMWGGFALALLSSENRKRPLAVTASQQELFEAVYAISSHRDNARLVPRAIRFIRHVRALWSPES